MSALKTFLSVLSLITGIHSQKAVYASSSDYIVLDVRTAEEFEQGHVTGAQNIDFLKSDFESKIDTLDKAKSYKLYCRSGNRSGKAEKKMKEKGFTHVENLGSLDQAKKKLGSPSNTGN